MADPIDKVAGAIEALDSLRADDLARRLGELEAERKVVRRLLMAARRREHELADVREGLRARGGGG